MSKPQIELKVIEDKYYDYETTKHETSPIPVTVGNIKSWESAKAFNPVILNKLPAQTLVDALKKLF